MFQKLSVKLLIRCSSPDLPELFNIIIYQTSQRLQVFVEKQLLLCMLYCQIEIYQGTYNVLHTPLVSLKFKLNYQVYYCMTQVSTMPTKCCNAGKNDCLSKICKESEEFSSLQNCMSTLNENVVTAGKSIFYSFIQHFLSFLSVLPILIIYCSLI